MKSESRPLVYIAVGMFGSAALHVFGAIMVTTFRGSVYFWMEVIPILAVLWAVTLLPLGSELRAWTRGPIGSRTVTIASGLSCVVFLALWVLAVFGSGSKVGLLVVVAYATAAGILLFLVSLPNQWTGAAYRVRMPMLVGGTFGMVCVGLYFMIGVAR